MASISMCDGCGKHSPDESGNYTHHNWFSVIVRRPGFLPFCVEEQNFMLCESCMGQDSHGEAAKKWLQKLVKPISQWFCKREPEVPVEEIE